MFRMRCAGCPVVLGLRETAERPVEWHTLRPGSGRLELVLRADGPTRTVIVRDHHHPVGATLYFIFTFHLIL